MKPLRIETIRDSALLREPTTIHDVTSVLALGGALEGRAIGFAWAALAHRALMSLLPAFDNLETYNARRRAVERVIRDRGLDGRVTDFEIEGLVELGSRLLEFRNGARKSSWSDLHYTTRHAILMRQHHRCVACGVVLNLSESGCDDSPELDHIFPFSMRGNIESNTRVICKRCNVAKHDHLTYITQGRLAVGDNFRSDEINMNRLLYWAVEMASSRCETPLCTSTSANTELHIAKRASLVPWHIDNVRVLCASCSKLITRFPK